MIENILPEIRQIRTEDIPHLIECVRRCYGDSYPSAMMYDPVLLQEALDNKLMYSVVAIGPNGRVIGHCALTFEGPHDHSPEVGKMIVDPDFRGHHIADAMAKERIAIAKELGLSGFWGACVTNHPYSQEEMISLGAVETGTLLGVSEPNTVMEGLQNFSDSRRSVIIAY
jgi:RimJ/RimL family protein N-acetyltransferase